MAHSPALFAALAASLWLGLAPPALAQAGPSANDIINSLKPGTNMGGLTRGIRPVGPGAPAEPATGGVSHHRRAAAASPAAASAPSISLTIDFETSSAALTPEAVHTLDHLGEALSSAALAHYRFRIEGHTDTVGSQAANKALSERRAQAVADYIVKYFHVSHDRLEPVGMGETGLLVATPPQTSEARNRRVQIVNIGA